jgi:hypothetical protein
VVRRGDGVHLLFVHQLVPLLHLLALLGPPVLEPDLDLQEETSLSVSLGLAAVRHAHSSATTSLSGVTSRHDDAESRTRKGQSSRSLLETARTQHAEAACASGAVLRMRGAMLRCPSLRLMTLNWTQRKLSVVRI